MVRLSLNSSPLFYWGDIHGKWEVLVDKKYADCNILQVGDFNMGFNSNDIERLGYLNDFLSNHNIFLYIIRGNHDDPFYFSGDFLNKWSNIKLLPDYTILDYYGKIILCVGGAISINRMVEIELQKKTGLVRWFSGEKFNYRNDVVIDIASTYNIDVVVTHSSPMSFYPDNSGGYPDIVSQYFEKDPCLISELNEERNVHQIFLDTLISVGNKPKQWIYGHFHTSQRSYYNGVEGVLLGINEFHDSRLDIEEND